MILPTKHIPTHQALLGAGAVILSELQKPMTISSLWENVRETDSISNYERFVLALDMLFIIGSISLGNNVLQKIKKGG